MVPEQPPDQGTVTPLPTSANSRSTSGDKPYLEVLAVQTLRKLLEEWDHDS
jgi:hypothetical protein